MEVVHDHLLHNIIDRHQIFTEWETERMKSQEGESVDALWVKKKKRKMKALLAEHCPVCARSSFQCPDLEKST